jgi:hypothetical protein
VHASNQACQCIHMRTCHRHRQPSQWKEIGSCKSQQLWQQLHHLRSQPKALLALDSTFESNAPAQAFPAQCSQGQPPSASLPRPASQRQPPSASLPAPASQLKTLNLHLIYPSSIFPAQFSQLNSRSSILAAQHSQLNIPSSIFLPSEGASPTVEFHMDLIACVSHGSNSLFSCETPQHFRMERTSRRRRRNQEALVERAVVPTNAAGFGDEHWRQVVPSLDSELRVLI